MSLREQTVSGVKWNAVSMIVVTGLQFARLIVLARLLTPSDFGLMGMIIVVVGFAQAFADMGISNAIIYRQDTTKRELSSLYWINIFAGVAVFGIVYAANPLIAIFFKEPRLKKLIYVAALTFIITPFGQQFQMLLQKELRFNRLAKIEIVGAFVNTATAILFALLGVGVFSIIFGQLAGAFAKVLLLVIYGLQDWRPELSFSGLGLKGYINFGLYQMGDRTINYFNTKIDHLLIGRMLGAESLGYYTMASNLIIKPYSIINPVITRVAFPVFSKVQNERERLKSGYLKVVQLLSMINFPIVIGLAAVSNIAVPVVFGGEWVPSVVLIQILAVVGLLRSINNPVGSLLLAKGRADLGFKWNLSLLITQVLGLYIGAKYGGTVGVASAYAILLFIYSSVGYFVLIKPMLGSCLRDYVASMWPSFWMSAVMGGIVFSAGIIFPNIGRLWVLIIQIILGSAIYLILMYYFKRGLFFELKDMILKKSTEQSEVK